LDSRVNYYYSPLALRRYSFVANNLLSILLLYAIPDSYESFRVAIESRDELPKPEVLKIKLLEECEARKNREPKHNDAMFARGKCQLKNSQRAIENSHRKDNEKSFKYKCYRCGKVGHMVRHCRSNPARQPQQRRINTQMTHQDCYPDKMSIRKLTLNYFRTFGERAYVLDKSPGKGKFSTRSKECICIGYSTEPKAYRLWCPAERKLSAQNQEWPANDTREKENETLELQLTPNESNETHQILPGRPRLVRSGRRGRPKKVYQKEEVQPVTCEDVASIAQMNDPKSAAEALSCDESKERLEAMKREYEALVRDNTWEIVNRPQRQKVITCQWVYNTKFNADGSIKQRKARLVAKGFLQRPNIDFHETYAPVARLSSIRTILAISANYGLIAHQLDFVSAYLNGKIEEEIYIEIPEKLDEVLKCSKVKQNLDGKGLKTTSGDPCVYFERRGRELTIAAIYVDDVIIASNNTARLNELKKALAKSFEMKDMGPIHYCLGIEIKQSANGDIEMSQQKYIMDILERFKMMNSKPVETPIDASNKLSTEMCPRTEAEKAEMQNLPYRSLVGSLMYLSVSTRPDIAFAKTASYGLRFQRNSGALMGFSDADWGGNSDDRRSYTGYVFKFGNAVISWESRKQRTVALSSTEAECMALSEACKEAMHLKRMIEEITVLCKSVVLQSDNQSAIKLARNPDVELRYLPTEQMMADVLTKDLFKPKHEKCISEIGVENLCDASPKQSNNVGEVLGHIVD
ncbi:Retrovirus-related Pol polyprotein from transposon TNT 1-94, partial [Trichinella spiralis]